MEHEFKIEGLLTVGKLLVSYDSQNNIKVSNINKHIIEN
jgi:hypothetical protein